MRTSKFALTLALAAMLSSCGGGGSSGGGATGSTGSSGGSSSGGSSGGTSAQCSLSERQDWALAQLQEWYLFPTLLDANVNKASHSNLQSYIDALVAPARAESKDRFFTYITSIEEENAFFEQGATAGFGFRLDFNQAGQVRILEAFENTPAIGQNIGRGSIIEAIGTSSNNLQSSAAILAVDGAQGIINALGPNTAGTTRVLRVIDGNGVSREVTLSKTEYALDPVSDIFGIQTINDGGKLVGYINLRTFIDTAGPDLIAAFGQFRQQGITELIIDQRYNGGGLISIAELMGDLMGESRQGQIFDYVSFRASKASENSSYAFNPGPQSIMPLKIAFIGTSGTASASEMVINGMQPYLAASNMALIGSNTFGKPVGQIALDQSACDDRFRVIALKIENADHQGEYFNGLAATVPNSCIATDDLSAPMGDPNEAMTAKALDFLAGRSCSPIAAAKQTRTDGRQFLTRENPNTAERNVPGLF